MFAESIERDLRSTRFPSVDGQAGLLELQKMAAIGAMASSISHDMRHWLSIICANIELLRDTNLPNAAKHEILVDLQEAITLMVGLTDSLLQFARTGREHPPSRTTIARIIESAIHTVKKHEILGILPFQCVAGRAEPQGEDLLIPAGTAYCGLDPILQSPTPSSSAWSHFRG